MVYQVSMTADAVRDLRRIVDYIAEHDLPERAVNVLDAIEGTIGGLADEPQRGSVPRELAAVGISEYRQVFFKPYRIIYRVFVPEATVYVYLIADGRRDLQSLLARRLLDPTAYDETNASPPRGARRPDR